MVEVVIRRERRAFMHPEARGRVKERKAGGDLFCWKLDPSWRERARTHARTHEYRKRSKCVGHRYLAGDISSRGTLSSAFWAGVAPSFVMYWHWHLFLRIKIEKYISYLIAVVQLSSVRTVLRSFLPLSKVSCHIQHQPLYHHTVFILVGMAWYTIAGY